MEETTTQLERARENNNITHNIDIINKETPTNNKYK